MPSKCPFCHQKYSRSHAYEKHLRTAHASLDIVLASTVPYNNIQTAELRNADPSECQGSDYESDPGPAGLEHDAFCGDIAYESDPDIFDTTLACAGKHNHFEGAGEVIRDVAGFVNEYSNLCHQQKLTLRLIRRRCVLTQAMYFLRPLRPVHPALHCNVH